MSVAPDNQALAPAENAAPPAASDTPPGAPPAAAAAPAENAPPASPAPTVGVRPEGLPDDLWDAATGLKAGDLVAQWRERGAKIAEYEAARGEVPTEAAGYAIAKPEDFVVPDGMTVQIDESHPFLKEARELALADKMSQPEWQRMLRMEAARQVAFQKSLVEKEVATRTALGENADQRIADIHGRLDANLSADQAKALKAGISRYSAPETIKAMEALFALKSGPTALPAGGGNAGQYEGLTGADLLAKVRADQAAKKAA